MPPDVLPLIRSRAKRWYEHCVTSSAQSGYSRPRVGGGGGVRLRWELGRGGGTCGVETERPLSLHTICSGMHLIKRKRGCMCALCNCSPYNHFSQRHKLQGISLLWGHTHGFPRPLILCQFSCKRGHTLPRSPDWAWEARCSLYSLNQSRLPGVGCGGGMVVIPTWITPGWNKAPENGCSCGKKQGEQEQGGKQCHLESLNHPLDYKSTDRSSFSSILKSP